MSAPQQRYRVIERIASGGMAEVFRAESAGLEGFKKTVAIKRVLPHLAGKTEFIGMFLDEARLSAHLGHSNCVQTFDIGQGDDTYFIVMEMVEGADLKQVIKFFRDRNQAIPLEEALFICVRLCEGLAYAHDLKDDKGRPLKIVHRDMSPPNVLMTLYGEVKIADFGLAKANSQLEHSQPGIIKGKFGYLSPEAAQGKPVDHRTDIFAVGIILWEMLSGRRLFLGDTDLATVKLVQRAHVPDIRTLNSAVPDPVVAVLARALAAEPNNRYQSARELGDHLNSVLFQAPRPVSSFDVARLVRSVVENRESTKIKRVQRGSLIGNLIDQALFQFTSLESRGSPSQSNAAGAASPIDVHSFSGNLSPSGRASEPPDWGSSLGFSTAPSAPVNELPQYLAGDLSRLEDDRVASHPQAGPNTPSIHVPSEPRLPSVDPKGTAHATIKTPLIVFLLFLFAVGGALGAYFSGAIPSEVTQPLGLPQR